MLLATAVPDIIVFVVAAIAILVGAIGVVVSRNPVHAALNLVLTLFGIAVEFINQQADFLAAVQVIVYAGAIVILFLFVIMLLGVDREENVAAEPLRGQRPTAIALGLMVLVELALLGRVSNWATGTPATAGPLSGPGENIQKLGQSMFTRYLFPFEITSVLLVIAVIGAVVLARRPQPVASEMTRDEQEAAMP
ncbi:MAG: NADH-quinone oxidoreductase subunit [Acidimicrobiaceae bacterium]|jgi:NADH-quinone oxidoreductase subunit J|nr:NADH-quinone oxidoreductase subunit [Acidimicrobiaceae bacterium]MDQ1416407.1 NADH-quinone oxidoreductase subunit [Acidimicrobiaceae bacterium]